MQAMDGLLNIYLTFSAQPSNLNLRGCKVSIWLRLETEVQLLPPPPINNERNKNENQNNKMLDLRCEPKHPRQPQRSAHQQWQVLFGLQQRLRYPNADSYANQPNPSNGDQIKMKAILIDSKNFNVKEIDLKEDEFGEVEIGDIHKHLDCSYFDVARIGNGDVIFVDDEGLFRTGVQPAFQHKEYHSLLIGNGVVLGTGASGESLPPKSTVEEIRDAIQFGAVGMKN